jgi:exonuclease III
MAAPTYAAPWYEIRISRDLGHIPGLPERGLLSSGRVAGLFKMLGPDGRFDGRRSDPFWADLPPARGGARLADARIPPRAEGSVRVVSYNVDRTAPASDPGPFARMLKALDPDIVLFQEWVEGTALDIEAWLNEHVPADSEWYAVKGAGWGVAVAARHPLEPLGPGEMYVEGSDRPVRFVGAGVLTPVGPAAVASVHLKCCGGARGPEDRMRMAEADAINSAMRVALSGRDPALSLIGGDVNLVGTRSPLEVLAAGLGPGRTDLQPAATMVLGDRAKYTWSRAESAYSPGRLDWMLAGAEVVNAFAVDTAGFTDAALSRAGLRRGDSRASDHLPVVVDLRPGG